MVKKLLYALSRRVSTQEDIFLWPDKGLEETPWKASS